MSGKGMCDSLPSGERQQREPLRLSRRQCLAGMAGLTATAMATPLRAQNPEALSFGLTPVFLTSNLALLERLQTYLEEMTDRPVRLVTRRTYQEITSLVVSGQVDAAWICGYPYVQYRDSLSLMAVPVWRGRPLYQSYLIADANRSGDDWRVIEGDIHAFSDPDSNSGYLVTAALLAEEGKIPDGFFRNSFYTYGHRNVVRAVASGLAQSGSVDGYVWEVMKEMEPELTGRTRILHASDWLGFPPIACARESAGARKTQLLQNALLGMEDSSSGRSVLEMLRLDGFTSARDGLFDSIARKVELVRRTA